MIQTITVVVPAFQYNLSHDNDGGFMLICNYGGLGLPKSIGNIGTIIRYNISVNDRLPVFRCSWIKFFLNIVHYPKNQPSYCP
jgi:hypothetical protein